MFWVLIFLLLTIIFFCTLLGLCAMWTGADADRRQKEILKRITQ